MSRLLTDIVDHTLWLEVEEKRENRAHTQHKHQRWPELCRGDVTTGLTLAPASAVATVLQWSLSASAPAAATVQQQEALSASTPATLSEMGDQQITLQFFP